ncbi:MAG TPA: hypothetical protein VM238_15930 [Phycisphaerae bacterium]|nr:hypothetical protein [Phycisphaerae bacterium]
MWVWDVVYRFFAHLFSPSNPLWLYYPLCAVVAVVYKATKFDLPKKIAWQALHFFASVSLGMLALALVSYVISLLL